MAGSCRRHRAAVWKNDTSSEEGDDERLGVGVGVWGGVSARHLTLLLQIKQVRRKTQERCCPAGETRHTVATDRSSFS